MTPLSYSLPSFHSRGFDRVEHWIDNLRALGFSWVTFTPTYLVYDETPLRIDPTRGPAVDVLRVAIAYARAAGLRVKLEPHLDYESTLTGGPYKWRAEMRFDPGGAYEAEILQPLADLAPDQLTLGSELETSVIDYAASWRDLARRIARAGLALGHKLNHDTLDRRRLPADLGAYLASLEYTAFSFYPPVRSIDDAAREFERKGQDLADKLRRTAGPYVQPAIGEFGLGSSDIARPWHFDASTFRSAEDFAVRRQFYTAFFDALRRRPDVFGQQPATFWTVTHFDILGALEWPGYEAFRDDTVRQLVQDYNSEAATRAE